MSKRQFHIQTKDVVHEKGAVETVFINAIAQFGLFDNTTTSRVPNTIISIVEKEGYGFGLGARIVGNTIIIDFFQNNTRSHLFYCEVSKYIEECLFLLFSDQIREAKESELIP